MSPLRRVSADRRGRAWPVLLCVLGLVLTGCASGPLHPSGPASPAGSSTGPASTPTASTPTASTPAASATPSSPTPSSPTGTAGTPGTSPSCRTLSLAEQVGQLFVMGMASTGASNAELTILQRHHIGGVILTGNTSGGISGVRGVTDRIRAASSSDIGVMITVDQEGGDVRRLRGTGFATMSAPINQATYSDAKLRELAQVWGENMHDAGIDIDLAPVADVVPDSIGQRNEPIAKYGRGYGSDPVVVGGKVAAFVQGLGDEQVGATLKHFPGLGKVIGNTDFVAKVVDDQTTRDDPDLAAFSDGIAAGADMVMISTAYYTLIDPDHPAAFSSIVIEQMLRHDRGYDGVVVSDDLGVAKAVQEWSAGERAVKFLQAGGDVIVNVDPGSVEAMVTAVLAKAADDPAFAAQVSASAERVLRLKAARGLTTCA